MSGGGVCVLTEATPQNKNKLQRLKHQQTMISFGDKQTRLLWQQLPSLIPTHRKGLKITLRWVFFLSKLFVLNIMSSSLHHHRAHVRQLMITSLHSIYRNEKSETSCISFEDFIPLVWFFFVWFQLCFCWFSSRQVTASPAFFWEFTETVSR